MRRHDPLDDVEIRFLRDPGTRDDLFCLGRSEEPPPVARVRAREVDLDGDDLVTRAEQFRDQRRADVPGCPREQDHVRVHLVGGRRREGIAGQEGVGEHGRPAGGELEAGLTQEADVDGHVLSSLLGSR